MKCKDYSITLKEVVRSITNYAITYDPEGWIFERDFLKKIEDLQTHELGELARIVDENRVIMPFNKALEHHDSPRLDKMKGFLEPKIRLNNQRRYHRDRLLLELVKIFEK